MRCLTLLFGIVAATSTLVSGSGYTDPRWSVTSRNQSSLFGYQLVGFSLYNTSDVCNNVSTISHGVWNGQVDTDYIEPAFCDQIGWEGGGADWDDYDIIQQNIKFFNTGTFLSQVLYAFDLSRSPKITTTPNTTTPAPYAYLCAALQPAYLEAFNLDSTRLASAICTTTTSNANATSTSTSNITALNATLLDTYDTYVSTLFAYLLISSTTTTPEADSLCFATRDGQPGVENTGMGLKGSIVWNVAYGRDGRRMSENERRIALGTWTTKVFLHVLENATDLDEGIWMEWLCGNLDASAMGVTGLDGEAILEEVCGGEKVGQRWCSDPYLC